MGRMVDKELFGISEQLETHDKRTETHACDLISRQAAIDALAEWHDVAITNRLNNLPSAQQWIPTSERLPEPEDEVLLTMDYKGRRYVELGNIWSDGTVHTYLDEYLTPDGRKYRKVIAWMPLPEPWKGEQND